MDAVRLGSTDTWVSELCPGTRNHRARSRLTAEKCTPDVALPDGYDESTDRYPTLYVLDAPLFFATAWITALTMFSAGQLPQHVVVGVGRPVAELGEWLELRTAVVAGCGHTTTAVAGLLAGRRELNPRSSQLNG